ncbi:MAG: hypothetical protein AB7J28_06650 [Hyphomonadaceae bacterium]
MTTTWIIIAALGVLVALLVLLIVTRGYIARTDRTYMTHDEVGFRRALSGWGIIWGIFESIVKGPNAPRLEYVAIDPTTGQRRSGYLLDPRTGSINLRPQYCVPLPFLATTADSHQLLVEARVQFSLNRDLMKYVYQLDDFGLALETRIQSAMRAEIGRCNDEVLRASLSEVESKVVERLRQAERDGDEVGEAGMALGVNFHTVSFTYGAVDDEVTAMAMHAIPAQTPAAPGEPAAAAGVRAARTLAAGQSALSLRPTQLDTLADVFKGRDAASTQALLAMLEMQTRQNIAEALAGSGQVIIVTTQEAGLAGATSHYDAISRVVGRADAARQAEAKSGEAARGV